jgi:hypothetical protein
MALVNFGVTTHLKETSVGSDIKDSTTGWCVI